MPTLPHDEAPPVQPLRSSVTMSGSSVGANYIVTPTGNPYLDALIGGVRWTHPVTYSFPDSPGDYERDVFQAHDHPGFGPISFDQAQAARIVMEGATTLPGGPGGIIGVEEFTNLSISFNGAGTSDIRLANSDHPQTAYAYFPPGPGGGEHYGGDVWFGPYYGYGNAYLGTYAYHTLIHELGHSLGLAHGHDGGGISGVPTPADRDSMEFTVMTYRSYIGGGISGYANEYGGFAQSWMMLDIAALQAIYGADFGHNAGNTTYRWTPGSGETFVDGVGQGIPVDNRIFLTIWDGGGNDTYDFSAYAEALELDLTPGGWSDAATEQHAWLGGAYAQGNVYNAWQYQGDARSLIENATGGSGNDRILGNAAANRLLGNGGADTLTGGLGADTLDGGAGTDTARYAGRLADYAILVGETSVTVTDLRASDGDDGSDTLFGMERLQFSDGIYTIGDPPPDPEDGLFTGGADRIDFNRVIAGTYPAGSQYAALGGDDVVVLARDSSAASKAGYDRSRGFDAGDGHDTVTGGKLHDSIAGGEGDDTLDGGAGTDTLVGGTGNDRYIVDRDGDRVIEAADGGLDTVLAADDYVLGEHVENLVLTGTSGNDGTGNDAGNVLTGNSGSNRLSGLGGADTLLGGDGKDTLDGGTGDDRMEGGSSDDRYLVDSLGDVVVELAKGGKDSVTSTVSYTLGVELESLLLAGSAAIDGTGNGLDNAIEGNAGDNHLSGGGGKDTLRGAAGADSLSGGDGNDLLAAGLGADTLTGGAGRDRFEFSRLDEVGGGASGLVSDIITDFMAGDRIDFEDIDAIVGTSSNNKFVFIGGGAFTAAGQLRVVQDAAAGLTRIEASVDTDVAAEMVLMLAGLHALVASDFVL